MIIIEILFVITTILGSLALVLVMQGHLRWDDNRSGNPFPFPQGVKLTSIVIPLLLQINQRLSALSKILVERMMTAIPTMFSRIAIWAMCRKKSQCLCQHNRVSTIILITVMYIGSAVCIVRATLTIIILLLQINQRWMKYAASASALLALSKSLIEIIMMYVIPTMFCRSAI